MDSDAVVYRLAVTYERKGQSVRSHTVGMFDSRQQAKEQFHLALLDMMFRLQECEGQEWEKLCQVDDDTLDAHLQDVTLLIEREATHYVWVTMSVEQYSMGKTVPFYKEYDWE